jgi:hypothetical protein
VDRPPTWRSGPTNYYVGRRELTEIYEKTTGQPLEKLKADMERDKFMNAEEAVAYGLVDSAVAVTWAVPRPEWVSKLYTRIARFFGSQKTFN